MPGDCCGARLLRSFVSACGTISCNMYEYAWNARLCAETVTFAEMLISIMGALITQNCVCHSRGCVASVVCSADEWPTTITSHHKVVTGQTIAFCNALTDLTMSQRRRRPRRRFPSRRCPFVVAAQLCSNRTYDMFVYMHVLYYSCVSTSMANRTQIMWMTTTSTMLCGATFKDVKYSPLCSI